MRLLTISIVFLVFTRCAFALDRDAIEERAMLLRPERAGLIACLSDVVDRATAQGMTADEFKETLPNSCPNQREEFRKAVLDRMIPTLNVDSDKGEELATWATQLLLIPIYNEFSGQVPYRYRLKDAEKAKTQTPEDIAFKSAKEKYYECLSKFGQRAIGG
jgi:hypothetical protein